MSTNPLPVLKELRCPNCGASLQQHLTATQTLVCPSCRSHVGVSGEEAEVLSGGSRLPPPPVPIHLGDSANLGDGHYVVLGRIIYRGWDPSDTSDRWSWTEWLLGGADGRILWLSYDDEAGFVAFRRLKIRAPFDVVMDRHIPTGTNDEKFTVSERYPAHIVGAEGELTWKAKKDDDLLMVEGTLGNFRYSIQKTPQELEMYEGKPISPDMLEKAFGKAGLAKTVQAASSGSQLNTASPNFPLILVGFFAFFFACIALVGAGISGGMKGQPILTQTVNLNQTTPMVQIPVELQKSNRPAIIKLSGQNSLPVNSFASIDVSMTQPDEEDVFIYGQDLWHETGYDEGYWEESDYDGQGRFVASQTGRYILEVEYLPESTYKGDMQIQVEIYRNGFYPTWLICYGVVAAILGVLLMFSTGVFHFEGSDDDD